MATVHYGGQAVMEGVMMRGQREVAVAVRAPDGGIRYYAEPLTSWVYRSKIMRLPFLRGIVLLWDALLLGTRALVYAANVQLQGEEAAGAMGNGVAGDGPKGDERAVEEPSELAGAALWGTVGVSLALGVGLFFVVPLLITRVVDGFIASSLVSNLIEGGVRLAILIAYLSIIGRVPDIRRVFQYHGAEHKTIHAHERGLPLDVAHIRPMPIEHPRCGTGFLLVVVLFSIVVFALLGRPPFILRIISRIVLVPFIAGVAYEFLKLGAKYYGVPLVRAILAPSMALQRLTTRPPTDEMLEVAAVALRRVLVADDAIPAAALADGAIRTDTKGVPLTSPAPVAAPVPAPVIAAAPAMPAAVIPAADG